MSELHDLVTDLSPEKRKLLEMLLKEEGVDASDLPIVSRPTDTTSLPLSFTQEGLWFVEQLAPGTSAYNIPQAVHLTGPLNVTALERSLNAIISRHEILRTTFRVEAQQPIQYTAPIQTVSLPMVDLREYPAAARQDEIQRRAAAEARQPFDLERGPLIRFSLLRLDDEEHIFLLTMHHIVSDGWSLQVFNREISSLYDVFANQHPSSLPALSIQYADYAIWQRQRLQGDVLEEQLSYWKKQLAAPSVLELPSDRSRPAAQTFRGARYTFALPQTLSEELKALSQREGVTLFMTLVAAYKVVLHRYTGQDDICIGSPVAGRSRSEIEGLIGFFANTLVLRTNIAGDPSFQELLGRVREVALDAYAHDELPFEKLVEVLRPERDLSRNPLFQVEFVLQDAAMVAPELPGLTCSPVPVESGGSTFDMTLFMRETEQGMVGAFEYATDLFDASTIKRMSGHLQSVLEGIVADPTQCLSDLPLITAAERQQLLIEWNAPRTAYPLEQCIHHLFEAQAARTPNAVAVVFEDQQLTYHQLNCRANQVARYLRGLGVGLEVLVGVLIERSLEMVIGLLGILKAGGAYVPLDPVSPQKRLAFMLEDAQISILLTQERLAQELPTHQARVVCLDTDWETIAEESVETLVSEITAHNLAYVIYTSGSTGKPKGVLVTHANVVRLFDVTQAWFQFGPADVWTLFHSYAFDFSVWEMWGALLYGGRLVVVPYVISRSPREFRRLLVEEKVTVLNQTPSAFKQLIQADADATTRDDLALRTVIFGGEALNLRSLEPWVQRHGDSKPRLINMYGITETTVHVTYRQITTQDVRGEHRSLIGIPLPDLQLYALNARMEPVPIGVPGELYVGGGGVARGYLNRPELTRQRFVNNSFVSQADARLYKTGDIARFLPNRDIEYLGRADSQVQLRGFRVELGEIETVLVDQPGIRQAVVTVQNLSGDDTLIAYYVTSENVALDEVRQQLATRLPSYMIPQVFVKLERIPLTQNGKIDIKSLPQPTPERQTDRALVPPRNETESVVAGLIQEVLAIECVGVYDNFFDLGAHSLLLTRILSRLQNIFPVEVPMRCLFERPTVVGIAQQITQALEDQALGAAKQKTAAPDEQTIPRRLEGVSVPLSFAQQRLWFFDQLESQTTAYTMSIAYRLRGRLNVEALEASLSEFVYRHESLRTTFSMIDGEPQQVIASAAPASIPVVDVQAFPESEREGRAREVVAQDAHQPFDLAQGPLYRLRLVRLRNEEHWLLVTMHHIIFDGWSLEILLRELSTLYNAFVGGQPSPLPELPVQYGDFALWQRQWLQGEVLETQLKYWKDQLAEAPPLLELPTDHPRPAVQSYRGGMHTQVISTALADALKALSRQEGATLFMTLLAAFKVLLSRYTGQSDIVVGTPIAGRNLVEVEDLIGFFLNTLALRTDLSGDPSFRDLLHRVREVALGAYQYQELPFEKLVEELQPERSLSYTPLFQVLFNVYSYRIDHMQLEGLQVEALPHTEAQSKFDLTVYVEEKADQLHLILVYNLDLFDAATMQVLLDQFLQLLTQVVAKPEEKISQFSLVTSSMGELLPDPRQVLGCEWVESIQSRFAYQAQRVPERPAVVDLHETWSYQELERRSNQLAHYLRAQHIGAQDVVAIYGHRSASLVWALLGTLKAGAAFVVLDPDYPVERLIEYVHVVQPRGWLQLQAAGAVPKVLAEEVSLVPCQLEMPDRTDAVQQGFLEDYPDTDPEVGVGPDDTAYVMFTSGSTGTPKAITGSHRPLSHFLEWHSERFALQERDRFSLLSGLAHDPMQRDIFTPLWLGATLCIPESETMRTPEQLRLWMKQAEISVTHLTPALSQVLTEGTQAVPTESREVSTLPLLRYGFFGGDVLRRVDVQRLRQLAPLVTCVNFYGATETPQAVGYYLVADPGEENSEDTLAEEKEWIPVGRGIDNVQLLVLTKGQQLAGIGEVGEIYVRTPYLAKGYLGDEALTAEKFLLNPFTQTKGDRLYKTGDLGRYLPDSQVEFLGRADRQVKVRGFRVELAEVEKVLARHPAVQEAVVDARQEGAGEPASQSKGDARLVAYIVPCSGPVPSVSVLLRFLRETLPEYMLPSAFMFLNALPLMPNGKLNRQALPEPEGLRPELDTSYEAPGSETEQTIAAVWQDVLGIEQVGRQDNFFDLGGHSLLLIQVRDKLQKIFHREIPIIDLFRHPTIHSLTQYALQAPSEQPGLQHSEDRAQTRKRALKQQQQLREKREAMVSADGGQNEYSGNVRPA